MGKNKIKLKANIAVYEDQIEKIDIELKEFVDKAKNEKLSDQDNTRQLELVQLKFYFLTNLNKDRQKLNEPSVINKKNMGRAAMILSPLLCAGMYGITQTNKKAQKMKKERKRDEIYKQLRSTL